MESLSSPRLAPPGPLRLAVALVLDSCFFPCWREMGLVQGQLGHLSVALHKQTCPALQGMPQFWPGWWWPLDLCPGIASKCPPPPPGELLRLCSASSCYVTSTWKGLKCLCALLALHGGLGYVSAGGSSRGSGTLLPRFGSLLCHSLLDCFASWSLSFPSCEMETCYALFL